ncbi:MAG: acetate kinase [Clostridia bacterium]|nr:acetate kinase [Clostridia bacterium]
MKILVINCGSSSLKYQLIDMKDEEVLAKGNFEKIGLEDSFLTHKVKEKKYTINKKADNHEIAIKTVLQQLTNKEYGVINNLDEISAVGHRIVQGGEFFDKSVLINDDVIKKIKLCIELAPLHNGAAIKGIEACKVAMPGKPMVATFDTAFHQTMPKENYLYPIPLRFYSEYKIRKYGAHGTSYRYVSQRINEIMDKQGKERKIVVCHLGQGASLAAIQDGKVVDTSMGLTPMGGIMMCQRVGDIDPSVITYMMEKENILPRDMVELLNKQSGLLGVTGVSSDFREIEKAASGGDEKAILAIKMYVEKVAEFIAKYMVIMQGIDVIAFTAGIGENQIGVREKICEKLKVFGVQIDKVANNCRGEETKISSENSQIEVWVVPTNEELVIARDTKKLV